MDLHDYSGLEHNRNVRPSRLSETGGIQVGEVLPAGGFQPSAHAVARCMDALLAAAQAYSVSGSLRKYALPGCRGS